MLRKNPSPFIQNGFEMWAVIQRSETMSAEKHHKFFVKATNKRTTRLTHHSMYGSIVIKSEVS